MSLGRTGDAGGGDGVVGAGQLQHTPRHGDSHFLANAALAVIKLVGHAQDALFQAAGVGNDAAGEELGTARYGAQQIADQAGGVGLRYRNSLALGHQHFRYFLDIHRNPSCCLDTNDI